MLKNKGQQHFGKVDAFQKKESVQDSQNRDLKKREMCKNLGIKVGFLSLKNKGITLIEIPYWWNRKISSLAATIYNSRPDMFPTKPQGEAIPLVLPVKGEDVKKINSSCLFRCYFLM